MKRSEKAELERLFGLFMDENDLNAPNFINRNQTAKLIKDRLSKIGRWKRLSRGKHQKKLVKIVSKKSPDSDVCPF